MRHRHEKLYILIFNGFQTQLLVFIQLRTTVSIYPNRVISFKFVDFPNIDPCYMFLLTPNNQEEFIWPNQSTPSNCSNVHVYII